MEVKNTTTDYGNYGLQLVNASGTGQQSLMNGRYTQLHNPLKESRLKLT